MIDDTQDQTVYLLLQQLLFQGKHNAQKIAEHYGLTALQANVLIILKEDEPKPMKVLSDYFMCDASTVTGLVDRMEKRGLTLRQPHPSDRRITLIALTSEGVKLREAIVAATIASQTKRLNSVLSDKERNTFQDYLKRILSAPTE